MTLKKTLKADKGMSLVEIMVVVALLSIVMAIGIPSYQNLMVRSRQKEGFNMLNAFYSAASAMKAEYGFFPGNLVGSSFAPEGQLIYRLRSEDNAGANRDTGFPGFPLAAFQNDDACITTAMLCDCGGACNNYKVWDELPPTLPGGALGPVTGIDSCTNGAGPNTFTNDNQFVVAVGAVINSRAANDDRYHMNETKNIYMCSDGLN